MNDVKSAGRYEVRFWQLAAKYINWDPSVRVIEDQSFKQLAVLQLRNQLAAQRASEIASHGQRSHLTSHSKLCLAVELHPLFTRY